MSDTLKSIYDFMLKDLWAKEEHLELIKLYIVIQTISMNTITKRDHCKNHKLKSYKKGK
jgi:hypothetical protein